jgi:hypothetical protein
MNKAVLAYGAAGHRHIALAVHVGAVVVSGGSGCGRPDHVGG